MKEDIIISVVIASYRRDKGLSDALNSLSAQTFRNFEIILVDDNDDPEWNEKVSVIVSDFKIKNDIDLIYLQNHPNQGSSLTRNAGIKICRGKYITFLDDDDIYLPEKLNRQYCFMEKEKCDYSVTDLKLYNEKNLLIENRTRYYINSENPDELLKYHLMYHITGTDTMMFKSTYIRSIGGFDPIDVGDEFYLMLKAINKGGKFGYLPICDVKAYVHEGNGGLSSGEQKIKGENRLFEYKSKYFGNFSKKDISYIKMRHYAVLTFALFRQKKFVGAVANAVKSVFADPVSAFDLLWRRKK